MKFFSIILFLSFSIQTMSGIKKGNGGNSLVCSNQTRLLDLYEGEILRNYSYDEQDSSAWEIILERKMQKLELLRSYRVDIYRRWLQDFLLEARFLEGVDLGEINDSLHVVIPANCKVKQTINQQFRPLPSEKRYWIDAKIWKKLNSFNKAALVFHEFVYREKQDQDSRGVRETVAFVFSKEFNEFSLTEIDERLKNFGH